MKSKFKIMDLLREGFKLNTLKKLDGNQISVLHKKLVNEQDTTSDKTEKIKNDLAMANQSAQQLSNELGEEELNEWGSSDQHFFNQSIHKQLGEPEKMPSPFSRELEDAVEDAVDFYWDDWEEYETDRDGLIVHGKRAYLRSYFSEDFRMMQDMFSESINEGTWGTVSQIKRFILDLKRLKDKYYDIVGSDDVFDGLDRAEMAAEELMMNAPENRGELSEEEYL